MKKIMIGVVAGICMLMTSCGNMNQVLSAMTNGTGVVNAITSVIGLLEPGNTTVLVVPLQARTYWQRLAAR